MRDYSTLIMIYAITGTIVPIVMVLLVIFEQGGIPAFRAVFYLLLTVGSISLMVYYSTPMYTHKFLGLILLILNCLTNFWISSGSFTISAIFRKIMIVLMITFFVMGAIFNYHPLMGIVYHFLDKF